MSNPVVAQAPRRSPGSSRLLSHLAFFGLCVLATVLTYQVHESGHYVAARLVGLQEQYLFSGVRTLTPDPAPWQLLVKMCAGPLTTLVVAVSCLALFLRSQGTNVLLLAATLETAFLRIQPMATDLFSRFAKFQDEFKIGEALGVPGRALMAVSLAVFLTIYITALANTRRGRVGTFLASFLGAACGGIGINMLAAHLGF